MTVDFLLDSTSLAEYSERELLRLSKISDQKHQDVILDYSLLKEYYSVARETVQRGADGRLVTYIMDDTPSDIIQSIKNSV
jgi:hypothetical protein